MAREQRLRASKQFRRVFADPLRASDKRVTLLARSNGLGCARLGLAASRRHLRRAVDRNLFKRIARESFRAHQTELAGLDVVVLARTGTATADRRQLRNSLDRQYSILQRRRIDSAKRSGNHG